MGEIEAGGILRRRACISLVDLVDGYPQSWMIEGRASVVQISTV